MHEPVLRKGYEPNIALEREPPEASEQRCDLATLCDVLGALLEFKGMPSLCCLTSVPRLLLLCFPSVVWIHLRPSGIQLLLEECVPWLRLKLLIPSFHLGPLSRLLHLGSSLPQLHLGASALQLQWAPSILRLHLGQTSPRLHHGLASCSVSPPQVLSCSSPLWYQGSSSDGVAPSRPPGSAVSQSPIRDPPPSAPSPSLVPMMLKRASRPCFLPPSTLRWASFLAGLWVPTLPLMRLVPFWLLPPFTSAWTVLFAPDCVCSRPLPRPPPEPCPPSLVGPCTA